MRRVHSSPGVSVSSENPSIRSCTYRSVMSLDLLRQCEDHPGNKHLGQSSPDGFVYWIISPVIFTMSPTSCFCFLVPNEYLGHYWYWLTTNNYFIINSKFYILKLKEKTTSYKTIFNSLLCFGLWCFCFICKILNVFKCFVSFDLLLYIIHVVSNVFSSVTLIWLSLCSLCIDRSVPITLHRTQTTSCCHAETLKLQNTCTVY